MWDKKLIKYSLINSFGVLVYIALVACLMKNADKLFGRVDGITSMVAFLLLFVLSATFVGGLVLGRPILMYLNDKKKEALTLFFYTVSLLAIFLFILLLVIFLLPK